MTKNNNPDITTTAVKRALAKRIRRQSATWRNRPRSGRQPSRVQAVSASAVRFAPVSAASIRLMMKRNPRAQAVNSSSRNAKPSDTVSTPATTIRNRPSTSSCRSSRLRR